LYLPIILGYQIHIMEDDAGEVAQSIRLFDACAFDTE
jgi:hypothetical protein